MFWEKRSSVWIEYNRTGASGSGLFQESVRKEPGDGSPDRPSASPRIRQTRAKRKAASRRRGSEMFSAILRAFSSIRSIRLSGRGAFGGVAFGRTSDRRIRKRIVTSGISGKSRRIACRNWGSRKENSFRWRALSTAMTRMFWP